MSRRLFSRRRLLRKAGINTLANVLAIPPALQLRAESQSARDGTFKSTLIWSAFKDPHLHLLRRMTFGPTPQLLAYLQQIGVQGFIEEQLHPELLDDSLIEELLSDFETLELSNRKLVADYQDTLLPQNELRTATALRAIYSQRQLYEMMVDFWSNHFNMHIESELIRFYKLPDDREVIRRHALGRFADLLKASAQSPAMLYYLDNFTSRGNEPNENYARELLELHTLSVRTEFTEEDVRNAAYCFTGWSIDPITRTFRFRPEWHYEGPLQVRAWRTGGRSGPDAVRDGLNLLDYLARHRQTARSIARKLCQRFVSDHPPGELVKQAAQVYLDHDTAIKPVLRHIFLSEIFWEERYKRTKFRRPFEYIAAVLRATNAQLDKDDALKVGRYIHKQLLFMGQPIFGWRFPDGYPDTLDAWLNQSEVLTRWYFLRELMMDREYESAYAKDGIHLDFLALLGDPLPNLAGEWIDQLAQRLLLERIRQRDRSVLLNYLKMDLVDPVDIRTLKMKTPYLATLLLNSSYFHFR